MMVTKYVFYGNISIIIPKLSLLLLLIWSCDIKYFSLKFVLSGKGGITGLPRSGMLSFFPKYLENEIFSRSGKVREFCGMAREI